MTACAPESIVTDSRTARHSTFTIAADGAYAARLNASAEDGWFPERWTLDGPEPYAVPLPGARPEETGSQVLPLTDGRVLIARREGGAHKLALLYPTGPATGELRLGVVESERLTLLPPAPCGRRAYALTVGEHTTGVWLVAGSSEGVPRLVAEVPGRCGGGAWLDREGRLLAVDRTDTGGTGRTKTVAVDLGRGGEVSPLLQITDDSDDRLLLADADSGLLIVRSDAPGEFRLGWGVLGSHRPVRFPESLHPEGALLTPFAVQPGQMLLPESCAVALHGQTTGARAGGAWLGVWRPMQKELRRFRAPGGWLPGKGVWTREGELRLPCATAHAPCGLARLRMRGRTPDAEAGATVAGTGTGESLGAGVDLSAAARPGTTADESTGGSLGDTSAGLPGAAADRAPGGAGDAAPGGTGGAQGDGPTQASGSAAGAASGSADPEAGEAGRGEKPPHPAENRFPAVPAPGQAEAARALPPGALPPELPPMREPAVREPSMRDAQSQGAPMPDAAMRLPAPAPVARDTGAAVAGGEPGVAGAQPAGEGSANAAPSPPSGPSAGTSAGPSAASPVAVTEPCARRKPVPLQDAPLATALHDAVVRARTA
ncbi:hypothetical protein DB35_17020 [Streptomyces abyssalis]|uniref:hypothetical protein n=1 Tax=Streptomyces abyssalis TaxID=933944 RepID=UPI00085C6830|nr:hypothetical protein DB35_17020 [Streptomyces abyssalis]